MFYIIGQKAFQLSQLKFNMKHYLISRNESQFDWKKKRLIRRHLVGCFTIEYSRRCIYGKIYFIWIL